MNQPDNSGNREDCVHLLDVTFEIGAWNDKPCDNLYRSLCKRLAGWLIEGVDGEMVYRGLLSASSMSEATFDDNVAMAPIACVIIT